MALASAELLDGVTPATCAALRARLDASGYDARLIGTAESIAPNHFDPLRLPLVRWALGRMATPGADLARLFAYGDAIPAASLDAALGPELAAAVTAAGLVRPAEGVSPEGGAGAVASPWRLMPFEGIWILADDPVGQDETVMGPGPTTAELAQLLPPEVTGSVLDVGCGAGTFALLAAARGAAVAVGTDINPRAVAVARFNARLNGLRAEFRAGDRLAPVHGERFDLVIAQPPFVTHPPDVPETTYLHGGAMGDEFAVDLVGRIPGVIAAGGRAVLLFESPVRAGDPLPHRLRAALGDAAVDLLVLGPPGLSPDRQAMGYGVIEAPDLGAGYAEAVLRYRRHLAALGIEESTHALVVLVADTKPGGRYTVMVPARSLAGFDAAALDATLAALNLASGTDAALAAARVRVTPRARFVEERPRPDRALEPTLTVRLERGGPGGDQTVSEAVLALLEALDASDSVDEAVGRYAELCETTPGEVRPQVIDFVRESLARGLLVPD